MRASLRGRSSASLLPAPSSRRSAIASTRSGDRPPESNNAAADATPCTGTQHSAPTSAVLWLLSEEQSSTRWRLSAVSYQLSDDRYARPDRRCPRLATLGRGRRRDGDRCSLPIQRYGPIRNAEVLVGLQISAGPGEVATPAAAGSPPCRSLIAPSLLGGRSECHPARPRGATDGDRCCQKTGRK